MDGYDIDSINLIKKYVAIQQLQNKQKDIDNKLDQVIDEMEKFPEVPENMDEWIASIQDKNGKFKLADYKKLFKVNKEYDRLLNDRLINVSKIKEAAIENILDQIKDLLKE